MDNEQLADELRLLQELGFTHLDLTRRTAEQPTAVAPRVAIEAEAAPLELRGVATVSEPVPQSLSFDELAAVAAVCTRCKLASTRTNVVWGSGNPDADLMFIGEAPGRDEDLAGVPFVGRAGQLLTDIIGAMKLQRDDVYIANVIKCRPPENRNPEPDELDACRPYIKQQIAMIKPRVIVTLGRFALQSTLERTVAISAARGEWLDFGGIRLMPTYHPAYLLRNPSAKKDVWNDMKKVMAELGLR